MSDSNLVILHSDPGRSIGTEPEEPSSRFRVHDCVDGGAAGSSGIEKPPAAAHSMSVTWNQTVALAEMFRIMGDPSRLRIILVCLDAPTCVGDIAQQTRLSPSLVSRHLRLLRAARVLRAERQGQQVFYAMADAHIRRIIADMLVHLAERPEDGEGEG